MTAPPENLADRPAAPTLSDDLLSELLRSVRLNGERVARYAPPPDFSVGFADTGCLHIVEAGRLAVRIDGSPDGDHVEHVEHVEHVSRGDFVLLPRGDPHHLSDAGDTGDPGAEGEPASWLCGTFAIGDPQASHLLGSLPAVIILRGGQNPALEGLEVARHMLGLEMQSPTQGSAVMVARILDLIFIQIMRTWAAGPDVEPNWLAGAFDPQIGLALSAMHRNPGHEWTVEELARVCSLSRSAFAARFADRVGKPPATYLAHVRLDVATGLLRDTSLPVTHIAERVGYLSEPAFSRAFKSRYGTPPARWRRDARGR